MQNVILLDGGMGQELIARSNKSATPLFSAQAMLDDPDMVEQLHRDFIDAGAELISLNAYAATPERLARDADIALFEPLQKAAIDLAHRARDKSGQSVRIAGCLPPLVASYHTDLVPADDQAIQSYRQIVEQQAYGIDLFIAETMSSVAEANYVCAAVAGTGKPLWVSFTVDDKDGTRLRSGEVLQAGIDSATAGDAAGILVNCSTPEAVSQAMDVLANQALPFGGLANGFVAAAELKAGDDIDGLALRNDLGPNEYATYAMGWMDRGATLIGGCCGVGPAHIAELRRRIDARTTTTIGFARAVGS